MHGLWYSLAMGGRRRKKKHDSKSSDPPPPYQASVPVPANRGWRMLQVLTGWIFLGILVPVIIGIGIGVLSMAPPEFSIAKACFSLAACILLAKTAWWVAFDSAGSAARERLLVCCVVFGLTGVLWAVSIIWIQRREPKLKVTQQLFSAEVRSAAVSDSGPLTLFVMTVGNTVSPIFYLAYIQITNLQDIPSVVDDVKIAVSKEPEGPWEDLVPMDLSISSHALFMLTSSLLRDF
jgi:hypothetical protein